MIDKIRLLIMEDNKLLREGFVAMLKEHKKLKVKTVYGDENKIDGEINRFNPQVILLNSGLQCQDSLEVVQHVIKEYPHIKIVIMGLALSKDEIIQFMDAGATGFILKDATLQEFIKTICAIAQSKIVIPELFTDLLLSQIVGLAVDKGEVVFKESVQISEFELKLLQHINEGLNDKAIGKKLGITPVSVKTHIHNIKQNLSLFSLLELVHTISSKSQPWDDDQSKISNN